MTYGPTVGGGAAVIGEISPDYSKPLLKFIVKFTSGIHGELVEFVVIVASTML